MIESESDDVRFPSDLRLLVCEGACNPHFPLVDDELKQYARWIATGTKRPGRMDLVTRSQVRSLRHTPHEPKHGGLYRCTICRTVRRY